MHTLILGGTTDERREAARRCVAAFAHVAPPVDAAAMPFLRPSAVLAPPGSVLLFDEIERAFPNQQSGGTRLVLTQSTYTLQKWIDTLGPEGLVVATADRDLLARNAPEALQGCGPWTRFTVIDVGDDPGVGAAAGDSGRPAGGHIGAQAHAVALLVRAFAVASIDERIGLCQEAIDRQPRSEVAHLALASACREGDDMRGARAELDRVIELAPDWEAAHYEDGKFWLGYDDIERAAAAFGRAAELMPTFSAAFSNLGATLGELDRPAEALAAFRQALAYDPNAFQVLNNIGVVGRELGRLDDSEAALRRVIELAPEFVFGHYNLGHTLFLAGKYREALASYEEGQRRDPEKNRRQGCRLAMMRLANGDVTGAERDLWRFANAAAGDEREDLLLEAHAIASALVAVHPELAAGRALVDRIAAEIGQ